MQAAAITEIGMVRRRNEDNYLVDLNLGLFLVADGMGGHRAGDVASRLAVETIKGCFAAAPDLNPPALLADAVQKSNQVIYLEAQRNASNRGMGTTITAALFKQDTLFVAHIGDSRAYLLRDEEISTITADHSVVAELIRSGGLTEAEAMQHPQRNVLTRALGTSPAVQADIVEVEMRKGDYILLCTDGLSGLLDQNELRIIMLQAGSIQGALGSMVAAAMSRGGADNITAILICYEG